MPPYWSIRTTDLSVPYVADQHDYSLQPLSIEQFLFFLPLIRPFRGTGTKAMLSYAPVRQEILPCCKIGLIKPYLGMGRNSEENVGDIGIDGRHVCGRQRVRAS